MISKLPGGQHMRQLDGLRTLAVAAVAWSHWMGAYQFGFEWGLMGVNLFFVLSGFLITGILLDSRAGAVGARRAMVCDPPVLRPAGAEDLPAVLHDTGAAGTVQRPPDSGDICLALFLPVECVFLSARQLAAQILAISGLWQWRSSSTCFGPI